MPEESLGTHSVDAETRSFKNLRFVYVLNIVSCFAVVVLHTTLPVYSPQPTLHWLEMLGLQACAIFAVPVFFMVSGMNLLGYRVRYSTSIFFRKRFWRVGRAMVLGSLTCYVLFCLFPYAFYGADQFVGGFDIVDFTRRFLTNQINDTYWFFYTIIYLYALTPILSIVVYNRRCLEYMLITTAAISVGIPLVERLGLNPSYVNSLFAWPFFSSVALLYFLLGYYLRTYWNLIQGQTSIMIVLFIASSVAMFALGAWSNGYAKDSGLNPQYDSYYVGITSPLCVTQAVALFLIMQSLEKRLSRLSARSMGVLKMLSGAALGVYMFHVVLINWMGVSLPSSLSDGLGSLPLMKAVVVYVITAGLVIAGRLILGRCKTVLRR